MEIDNEFALKQVNYSAGFEFGAKSTSDLLDYIMQIEKETQIIPIKLVLS